MNDVVRDYPNELSGVIDPRILKRLNQLFEMIYQLHEQQQQVPAQTQQAITQKLQLVGLLGPLGQNLVGVSANPDPQLQQLPTGNGTVTSVTVSGDPSNGLNSSGSPVTSNGTISLTFGASINVATSYKVAGTQVVAARGAAVADATGAGDVVGQLNLWLARARSHGLIAP